MNAMGLKNKGLLRDQFKQGKLQIKINGYSINIQKDPLSFVNSQEFRQIQKRNKKSR